MRRDCEEGPVPIARESIASLCGYHCLGGLGFGTRHSCAPTIMKECFVYDKGID